MTTITRTFTVQPEPAAVLAYLEDFANAEEWDPGTESCTQIGEGPVVVGTRWHNTSKIMGVSTELEYVLVERTDQNVVFTGENDTASTRDTIRVVPTGHGGSEITYTADIDLKGVAKLGTPVVKVVFEKIGSDTEEDMVTVLNRLG